MGVIWKQKFLMYKKSDMYPQYWTPSIGGIYHFAATPLLSGVMPEQEK